MKQPRLFGSLVTPAGEDNAADVLYNFCFD